MGNRDQGSLGKVFSVFWGIVVLVGGVGGGIAAVADGNLAGIVVVLVSIPMAGLCFSAAEQD